MVIGTQYKTQIKMRFVNVEHKYKNNIDVENTMKVVKYPFD